MLHQNGIAVMDKFLPAAIHLVDLPDAQSEGEATAVKIVADVVHQGWHQQSAVAEWPVLPGNAEMPDEVHLKFGQAWEPLATVAPE